MSLHRDIYFVAEVAKLVMWLVAPRRNLVPPLLLRPPSQLSTLRH